MLNPLSLQIFVISVFILQCEYCISEVVISESISDKQEHAVMIPFLNSLLLFPCSYRPGILDVSFIRSELAIGMQEEEWQKFESSVSLVYTDESKQKIDCKKSTADVVT